MPVVSDRPEDVYGPSIFKVLFSIVPPYGTGRYLNFSTFMQQTFSILYRKHV